jgi:hypothetical protein
MQEKTDFGYGWLEAFKKVAKKTKTLYRMINQAKLRSSGRSLHTSLGTHTKEPLRSHGIRQNEWQHKVADAETLEPAQLDEYEALGVSEGLLHQKGTRRSYILYTITNTTEIRPDLWLEDTTNTPIDSIPGVVSLKGL